MPLSEEISIRVQGQGTTVMAVYEVLGNTLILASADFSDAQAPLESAQPGRVASRLLHALAEAAMTQGGDPFMHNDGSPQQSEKGEKSKRLQCAPKRQSRPLPRRLQRCCGSPYCT